MHFEIYLHMAVRRQHLVAADSSPTIWAPLVRAGQVDPVGQTERESSRLGIRRPQGTLGPGQTVTLPP